MTQSVDFEAVEKAARILSEGGLVAIPTETVYGLAADADNREAVLATYAAKGRPADHPLIVHVAGPDAIPFWAVEHLRSHQSVDGGARRRRPRPQARRKTRHDSRRRSLRIRDRVDDGEPLGRHALDPAPRRRDARNARGNLGLCGPRRGEERAARFGTSEEPLRSPHEA